MTNLDDVIRALVIQAHHTDPDHVDFDVSAGLAEVIGADAAESPGAEASVVRAAEPALSSPVRALRRYGVRQLPQQTPMAALVAIVDDDLPSISPLASEPIDRADAERLASVLKALAEPVRLRLLSLIQSAPDREACVVDLAGPMGLTQPTISRHLRILTEAGLLEREKRGVWAFYRLAPSAIGTIADLLTPPRTRKRKPRRRP